VGANIGAGQTARALQIALIGGALSFALTESERMVGECELVVKLIHDFNKVALSPGG
jgi:hypothetical protein